MGLFLQVKMSLQNSYLSLPCYGSLYNLNFREHLVRLTYLVYQKRKIKLSVFLKKKKKVGSLLNVKTFV